MLVTWPFNHITVMWLNGHDQYFTIYIITIQPTQYNNLIRQYIELIAIQLQNIKWLHNNNYLKYVLFNNMVLIVVNLVVNSVVIRLIIYYYYIQYLIWKIQARKYEPLVTKSVPIETKRRVKHWFRNELVTKNSCIQHQLESYTVYTRDIIVS